MVRDYFLDFVYKTKKKKNVRIWLLSLLKDLCKQSATSKYVFTQPTKHTLSFLPTMTWTYQEVLNLFFILFFTIHNITEHGLTHQNETQFPPQSVSPIRKLPQTSYPSTSEGKQTENHNHRKLTNLTTWTTAAAKSLQSCPTLCDPIDGSPPGSPVPGILQARILKRLAIPFSRGPRFVRTFHHDPSSWVALCGMAHSFTELDKAVVHVIRLVSFL